VSVEMNNSFQPTSVKNAGQQFPFPVAGTMFQSQLLLLSLAEHPVSKNKQKKTK